MTTFKSIVVSASLIAVLWGVPAEAQLLTGFGEASQPPPAVEVYDLEAAPKNSEEAPVDLQADSLEHDEESQTVTATGHVMLVQAGRILRADEISYNTGTDTVIARGHVVLNEESGDIHYAEAVTLTGRLKDGFVTKLKTTMNDGSRFWAEEGERKGGTVTVMHDATYTPCTPCEEDPEADPAWQIRAGEVEHDEGEHRVNYKHARFEVYGVPVAYTPYFSHPDGSVKRKSGFLSPSAGYRSDLGTFAETSYYWNIAPDKDATIGVMAMTEEAPLLTGEWRQRWQNADLKMKGGVTYSGRNDSVGGMKVTEDEKLRGHIIGNGRWDMNEKWRSGVNVEWASDDQYMRQYDFSNHDVLANEVYAERFSGRDYAVGRLLTFQDIRVREEQVDQPEVLPEIITSFVGEPGSVPVVGGRWELGGSFLGLRREASNQDMNRLSLNAGWQRRLVSDYGMLIRVNTSARTDFYNTRDRDVATAGSGRNRESSAVRFFPQVHVQSSYPVAKAFEKMQATIEPVVALTVAPNIDVDDKIPNEDSQDVQIDASNIFEPNRFPGFDRVEDRSRLTYGVRSGLYGYGGSYGDAFLGQSFRLSNRDNPFPEGSGLDRQKSDIVGQIAGRYDDTYMLDYRFQLASDDFSAQRHEVDVTANWNRFQLGGRYLFAESLEGTNIEESRNQLQGDAAYYLTKTWRTRVGATQDFGDTPGLRKIYAGLDSFGQCVFWSLQGNKNFTDDSSGESDVEVVFRIGLKNLGEFEESGLRERDSR